MSEAGLGSKELDCLSQSRVYWPEDKQCYDLLSAGPCSRYHFFIFIFIFLLLFSDCFSGEWLVLEKSGAENRYFKTTESVYKNKRKKKDLIV